MDKIYSKTELNKNLNLYKDINLCEIDIYTQVSFQELQKQRFELDMDYYICIVEEGGHTYQFDAYQFMRSFSRDNDMHNPLTNRPIEDFSVYFSSKENPEFIFYDKKENILNNCNSFPLYWNEPRCSLENRIVFLLQYGEKNEGIDEQKAIKAYEKAHTLGSINAKMNIANYYKKKSDIDSYLFWAEKLVTEVSLPSIQNVLFCASEFRNHNRSDKAYGYYLMAAEANNLWGMIAVIYGLENGIGVEINTQKAEEWRKKLPEKWQNASMDNFSKYLQSIHYGYKDVGFPLEEEQTQSDLPSH